MYFKNIFSIVHSNGLKQIYFEMFVNAFSMIFASGYLGNGFSASSSTAPTRDVFSIAPTRDVFSTKND